MSASDCSFGCRACNIVFARPACGQLEGWFNSPEYKTIRAVGEKYAKYRNFAVPGVAQ
jgi:uncharacterized protein (DUF1330 family)